MPRSSPSPRARPTATSSSTPRASRSTTSTRTPTTRRRRTARAAAGPGGRRRSQRRKRRAAMRRWSVRSGQGVVDLVGRPAEGRQGQPLCSGRERLRSCRLSLGGVQRMCRRAGRPPHRPARRLCRSTRTLRRMRSQREARILPPSRCERPPMGLRPLESAPWKPAIRRGQPCLSAMDFRVCRPRSSKRIRQPQRGPPGPGVRQR